jgi:kynurenine formamidase
LRNSEGPSGERLTIGTHAAPHVDAPWHYNSEIQGRPAETIDQLPLENFFGPGVVVDAPLDKQTAEAIERDEPGIFWAAHRIDRPYSQIERTTNLDALPATGFTVACFPLKIKGASAGLTRAVAIVEE